jgi:hypothetical protein
MKKLTSQDEKATRLRGEEAVRQGMKRLISKG